MVVQAKGRPSLDRNIGLRPEFRFRRGRRAHGGVHAVGEGLVGELAQRGADQERRIGRERVGTLVRPAVEPTVIVGREGVTLPVPPAVGEALRILVLRSMGSHEVDPILRPRGEPLPRPIRKFPPQLDEVERQLPRCLRQTHPLEFLRVPCDLALRLLQKLPKRLRPFRRKPPQMPPSGTRIFRRLDPNPVNRVEELPHCPRGRSIEPVARLLDQFPGVLVRIPSHAHSHPAGRREKLVVPRCFGLPVAAGAFLVDGFDVSGPLAPTGESGFGGG